MINQIGFGIASQTVSPLFTLFETGSLLKAYPVFTVIMTERIGKSALVRLSALTAENRKALFCTGRLRRIKRGEAVLMLCTAHRSGCYK